MKKLTIAFLAPVFAIGMLASCGGGGKEHAEGSHDAEGTEGSTEEAAPVYSQETVVGVVHSVADLEKWTEVYEEVSDPNARISVYENVDNPSEIVVFEFTVSHEEAKAGFASDELKAAMERAGVNSEPVFTYYDIKYLNLEATEASYRVGISHEVMDFETWKPLFDADEERRAQAGLELRALATDADNANLVHIYFATDNLEPVKGMMDDPDLKAKMEEGGVVSEPVFAFWQKPGM
jgi:hypothetical protein